MSNRNEMFNLKGGKKADADLHEPILNNPEAEEFIRTAAIARALARGMSLAEATTLYG